MFKTMHAGVRETSTACALFCSLAGWAFLIGMGDSVSMQSTPRQPDRLQISRGTGVTCHYSETQWRDVLYNSVRKAPGGVEDAAEFLSKRRGRSIHREQLRQRLRGVDGDSISMEMAELLTEWLQDLKRPDALDWLHAFNSRFGLAASALQLTSPKSTEDAVRALHDELLQLNVLGGRLTELGLRTTADGKVDEREADALQAQAMEEVRKLLQLVVDARVAAGQGGAA